MVIKRNIVFDLENRKAKGMLISENVPIRIRVTFSGNRIELSSGLRIDRIKWDNAKQKVKNGCFNKQKQSSSDINSQISGFENELQNIFKEFEIKNTIPTSEEIKLYFNKIFNNTKNQWKDRLFFDFFDEFVSDNGKQKDWTISTYAKFNTLKNQLQEFHSKLSFFYFDENGLTNFVIFLRDVKKMRNSTVQKQISFLKWFLKWAKAKGYNTTLAFEEFKPKLKSTQKKIIFLTIEELNIIRNFEIPENKQYLFRVRDILMFLCYSGIRYSDCYNLKKSDVKNNSFEITTVKTNDSLVIELNDTTREILNKYKKVPFKNDKALPVISNQKLNLYIRELAELAKIEELIRITYYIGNERKDDVVPKYKLLGSHVGRRTFICMALQLNIPINVVMKWTGHSDYKSMKPYIDIADSIKSEAMKKFNEI